MCLSRREDEHTCARPSLKQLIDSCRMITVKIDGSHDARILTDKFIILHGNIVFKYN